MIATDLVSVAPVGGLAGLVAVLMGLQYRSVNDQRNNEMALRAEFAKERAALRAEFETERERNRKRIVELETMVDVLRGRVDRISDGT